MKINNINIEEQGDCPGYLLVSWYGYGGTLHRVVCGDKREATSTALSTLKHNNSNSSRGNAGLSESQLLSKGNPIQ